MPFSRIKNMCIFLYLFLASTLIHVAHTTPYWLNGVPTREHKGEIENPLTYINKERKNELGLAMAKHICIKKWLSNNQINHKLSKHFMKAPSMSDAEITHTLKFCYAEYIGSHMKSKVYKDFSKYLYIILRVICGY